MSTRQRKKAIARKAKRDNRGPFAKLKWLRISPRKVRLVVDMIRGEAIEKALNILLFSPKAAAKPVYKLLHSAIANADNKDDYNVDNLYIKFAYVDEGTTWRRMQPHAMGKATRIRKRTSHVSIELGERT